MESAQTHPTPMNPAIEKSVAPPVNAAPPIPADLPVARGHLPQTLLLLIGLGMLFGGQIQIMRDPPDALNDGNLIFILIGLAITLIIMGRMAILRLDEANAPATPDFVYAEPFRIKFGWLALAIGLSVFASLRAVQYPQRAFFGEYMLVWFGSMIALVLAVLPKSGQPYAPDKQRITRREWVLIGVLLVLAAIPRITELGTVPYLFDQDESKFAQEAAELWQGRLIENPFAPGIDSHPRIFTTLVALAVGWLGPTIAAARLPAAIAGLLGIPAVYLLGREIYGKRVGLVAALFTVPWVLQVFFSKQGMNQPFDPLFATLAFYFMLRGLRRRALIDFMLSGIFLGHAQMYYLGGRLVPFVMVSYLVYQWLRDRPQPIDRRVLAGQLRNLLLIPLAGFIVTLPMHFHLFYYKQPLSTRADKNIFLAGEFAAKVEQGRDVLLNYLKDQVVLTFNGLYVTQDRSGWIGSGAPLMGPFGAPLLILGVICTLLLLWKRPRWVIALGWAFTVIMVTGVAGTYPPFYERYYPAVAALALLVGAGAAAIGAAAERASGRPNMANRVTVGIGIFLLVGGMLFYYVDFVPAKKYINNEPNHLINDVTKRALVSSDAGRYPVLLIQWNTEVFDSPVFRYLMFGRPFKITDRPVSEFDQIEWTAEATQRPVSFFLGHSRLIELGQLRDMYPDGNLTVVYNPIKPAEIAYYIYDAPTPLNLPPPKPAN